MLKQVLALNSNISFAKLHIYFSNKRNKRNIRMVTGNCPLEQMVAIIKTHLGVCWSTTNLKLFTGVRVYFCLSQNTVQKSIIVYAYVCTVGLLRQGRG
jgi:hypothetical protein